MQQLRRAGHLAPSVPVLRVLQGREGRREELKPRFPVRRAAGAIALSLALGTGNARARDPWLGRDKALHFGASVLISSSVYGGSALLFESRTARIATASVVSLSVGAGKELYDLTGRGDPSWRDFTWDVIGTAVGVSLALLIDYALGGDQKTVETAHRAFGATRELRLRLELPRVCFAADGVRGAPAVVRTW